MKKKSTRRLHPQGEQSFAFPTAGGTVRLTVSGDAPMWSVLPEHLILDKDSRVQSKYGRLSAGERANEKSGRFWEQTQHEFKACVTDPEPAVANAWQIVEL